MIAKAFGKVAYPVLPGTPTLPRHYSQVLPRDFDLSPNFQIIKFNTIEDGDFASTSSGREGPRAGRRETDSISARASREVVGESW